MYTIQGLSGVALVTGAASGIGQATILAFAKAGCKKLALLDMNEKGLSETEDVVRSQAKYTSDLVIKKYICDVTSPEVVEKVFQEVHSDLGRIDYTVNSAGIIVLGHTTAEMPIADFDLQNSVTYRGLWLCNREALKIMKTQSLNCEAYPEAEIPAYRAQRGSIVNISSALAKISRPQSVAYCAAKAAVSSLTKTNALDFADDRIRINAILPGVVDSPLTNPTVEFRELLQATEINQRTPMKRFGQPEEIADAAIFLSGSSASYVTGTEFVVDGGYLI